ncbi:hypothetical protein LTS08_003255 [Lithohypha guttulata]|nr:hypothetical protein LTS08_003255 [Lithohypha guttulata]
MQLLARFRNQYEKTRQRVKTAVKGRGNKLTKRSPCVEFYKHEEDKVQHVADTDHAEWSHRYDNLSADNVSLGDHFHVALARAAKSERDGSDGNEPDNLGRKKNKEEDLEIEAAKPSDLSGPTISLEPAIPQIPEVVAAEQVSSLIEPEQDPGEEEGDKSKGHSDTAFHHCDKGAVTQNAMSFLRDVLSGNTQIVGEAPEPVFLDTKKEDVRGLIDNNHYKGQRERVEEGRAISSITLAPDPGDDGSDARGSTTVRMTSAEAFCDARSDSATCDPTGLTEALPQDEATENVSHRAEIISDVQVEEDEEDGCGDDESDFERFEEVRNAIDLKALRRIALSIRKHILNDAGHPTEDLSCAVHEDTRCGSYNIAFLIIFNDDEWWVAKVPGYGKNPSRLQREKMESEYKTAQYIHSKTTFKMPEIYSWTTDPTVIGVAFGLISFMEGISLWDCWQDPKFDHQNCLRAIGDVAEEMTKLYCLQFQKTGMLRFNGKDLNGVDYEIEYEGSHDCSWAGVRELGPFETTNVWIENTIAQAKIPIRQLRARIRDHRLPTGEYMARTMLQTIPEFMRSAPLSLCLADPDFQNIFVDSDTGELIGFIDLDNLHVAPVVVGSAAYPPFITRDRNMGKFCEEAGEGFVRAQGPGDRHYQYREHYAKCFQEALPPDIVYDPRWTQLSHHVCMLEYSTWTNNEFRSRILVQMARDAYRNVYGGEVDDQRLGDMRKKDMSSHNPLRVRRFKKIIRKGLWMQEKAPGSVRGFVDRLSLAEANTRSRHDVAVPVPSRDSQSPDMGCPCATTLQPSRDDIVTPPGNGEPPDIHSARH